VAIGIGRVIPELDPSATRWPYTVIGAAFAVYGVALMAYGSWRGRAVETALDRGEFAALGGWMLTAMTVAGAVLGLGALVLILID
jgi:hypothetical protein